jgi:hypothetical protein
MVAMNAPASRLTILEAVRTRMGKAAENINDSQHTVNTRFFEVTGQLRHGQVYQLQKSLIQRDGTRQPNHLARTARFARRARVPLYNPSTMLIVYLNPQPTALV